MQPAQSHTYLHKSMLTNLSRMQYLQIKSFLNNSFLLCFTTLVLSAMLYEIYQYIVYVFYFHSANTGCNCHVWSAWNVLTRLSQRVHELIVEILWNFFLPYCDSDDIIKFIFGQNYAMTWSWFLKISITNLQALRVMDPGTHFAKMI